MARRITILLSLLSCLLAIAVAIAGITATWISYDDFQVSYSYQENEEAPTPTTVTLRRPRPSNTTRNLTTLFLSVSVGLVLFVVCFIGRQFSAEYRTFCRKNAAEEERAREPGRPVAPPRTSRSLPTQSARSFAEKQLPPSDQGGVLSDGHIYSHALKKYSQAQQHKSYLVAAWDFIPIRHEEEETVFAIAFLPPLLFGAGAIGLQGKSLRDAYSFVRAGGCAGSAMVTSEWYRLNCDTQSSSVRQTYTLPPGEQTSSMQRYAWPLIVVLVMSAVEMLCLPTILLLLRQQNKNSFSVPFELYRHYTPQQVEDTWVRAIDKKLREADDRECYEKYRMKQEMLNEARKYFALEYELYREPDRRFPLIPDHESGSYENYLARLYAEYPDLNPRWESILRAQRRREHERHIAKRKRGGGGGNGGEAIGYGGYSGGFGGYGGFGGGFGGGGGGYGGGDGGGGCGGGGGDGGGGGGGGGDGGGGGGGGGC